MKRVGTAAVLLLAFGAMQEAAADTDADTTVYTGEMLDAMFGPPPPPASDPVDKTTPADWAWVESYLDRQYSRIDADREYELKRRVVDIADDRTRRGTYRSRYYGYGYAPLDYDDRLYGGGAYGSYDYPSLSLGYPASTWWGNVHRTYTTRGAGGPAKCATPSKGNRGRGNGRPAKR